MLLLAVFIVFIYVSGFSSKNISIRPRNRIASKPTKTTVQPECGVDRIPKDLVQEGLAFIETFPWLGLLIYPIDRSRPTTTAVILITREIALSTALDIDYYPKEDFRTRSRVILGNNCSGPFIRIREYSFHPDFTRSSFSTLAIVQLDTRNLGIKVFPICAPPEKFADGENIYAMSLVHDCYNSSMVMIYKMEYVDLTHCRDYYRRIELDVETMWPTHLACAQGLKGGHCIWRSGTALVIRHDGQWKLLGMGIYGPGCQSPSRFLDYGMYHLWVRRTIARIGQPAITRMGPNQLILRRTTKNIQRYGPCDPEESKLEIFSEKASYVPPYFDYTEYDQVANVYYNVTLLPHVEYHCIVLKARDELNMGDTPIITMRRWCVYPKPICVKSTTLTVFFYVEIKFSYTCSFKYCGPRREKPVNNLLGTFPDDSDVEEYFEA